MPAGLKIKRLEAPMKRKLVVVAGLMVLTHIAMAADAPIVLDVWPGNTPSDSKVGQYGPITEEHFRPPSD